jgi:Na+-translocating ferredoxin:NAD+ oxidoreductase RnfD subunit
MSLPHSGLSVAEFYSMHFLGALFPLTAGVTLYGWRALASILLVCGSAALGIAAWRRIGPRGHQLSYAHGLWLALLLSLMLPAHLATTQPTSYSEQPWPLLPAAGFILSIFLWLLGGLGSGRVHPVLVTYLLITALFIDLLVPHWVLQRNHAATGDLLHGRPADARLVQKGPWLQREKAPGVDSESTEPAAEALSRYTSGREKPPRGWLPLQGLLRDNVPPLEDLIVGGHPGPIGASSAIAVIVGGLFLLYRGLIDYRIPMIIIAVEFAGLLILPIPSAVTAHTHWHWIASRSPGVGWAAGITFANYEVMASPVLFMAFFLATSPSIRPMARRARIIYAILAGGFSAALQLYLGVSFGPYLALLLASLLTPALDMVFRPRALV